MRLLSNVVVASVLLLACSSSSNDASEASSGDGGVSEGPPSEPGTNDAAVSDGGANDGAPDSSTSCAPGTFRSDGGASDACVAWSNCAPGSFVATAGTPTSDRTCSPCADGTYSDAPNATQCMAFDTCPAGTMQSSSSTGGCAPCAAGSFTSTENATTCSAWSTCDLGIRAAGTSTSDAVCSYPAWLVQLGTSGDDRVWSLASDARGNTYFSTVGDIRKFDGAGKLVWSHTIDAAANTLAKAVAVGNGVVYIAGQTSGTMTNQTSAGKQDAFVRAYDFDGNELWTRQFGTSNDEYVEQVFVDSTNTAYVSGSTSGSLSGTSQGSYDAYVRKYDSLGNSAFTLQYGSPNAEGAAAVAVDASGNIFTCGATQGSLYGTNQGINDFYVAKFDSLGARLWAQQLGNGGSDECSSLALAPGGGVYVGGLLMGQAAIYRFDANGNEIWHSAFGTSSTFLMTLGVDAIGNAYVAGGIDIALPGQVAYGGEDVFVRKYDVDGNDVWTRQLGSPSLDRALGIDVAPDGDVHVGGMVFGAFPGQTHAGGADGFVMHLVP